MNSNSRPELEKFPRIRLSQLRYTARFFSTKCFNIPINMVKTYFDSYYLLYWEGSYIIKETKGKGGELHHNGTLYQIVYKSPLTRGAICANLQDQYAISFRQPKINCGLDLPAIAMIAYSRTDMQ
jgi:hypothetical protein